MARGKRRGGFAVVPAGFTAGSSDPKRRKSAGGPNVLRRAHGSGRSAAEIWFRKCGHGERLFADYYRAQPGLVPPVEWDAFASTLRQPLPLTFRVHGGADADALEADLAGLPQVRRVSWAPATLGLWQADASVGRRSVGGTSTVLADLLADGARRGLLNRQELVSALPVIALRVPPAAFCLDLCASPGSKTMQLLEAVSATSAAPARGKTPCRPAGMVVANDVHPARVSTLLDAIRRHGRAPRELSRLVVTCHAGERFPAPRAPFRRHTAGARRPEIGFDIVLADVPCSGDGTVRKDASVLPRWCPAISHQLHTTQLELAWRALRLLAVGGMCRDGRQDRDVWSRREISGDLGGSAQV